MAAQPPDEHARPQDTPTAFLARAAKSGEGERFARLYERIAPAVYTWASLRIRPSVRGVIDPEDLVQEVWCRALRRFHTFDVDATPFRPWVFRIANNVLLEAFKGIRGRVLPKGHGTGTSKVFLLEGIPDEATSISRRASRDEGIRHFIDRVADLGAEEKRLLLYRGLEGLSHSEVAERLAIGEDSVRKRWQRLRSKLEEMAPPNELFDDA